MLCSSHVTFMSFCSHRSFSHIFIHGSVQFLLFHLPSHGIIACFVNACHPQLSSVVFELCVNWFTCECLTILQWEGLQGIHFADLEELDFVTVVCKKRYVKRETFPFNNQSCQCGAALIANETLNDFVGVWGLNPWGCLRQSFYKGGRVWL